MSLYVVSLAPAIARLTSDKARATGFSVSTSSSIALGIFGNWLGGHLPGWLGGKRPAMLAGCALVALALWPSARLRIGPAPAEGTKLYPRNRFVVRFLIVWAIWNLATGSFNPFFTTFFARLHTPVERIGLIMSGSQLAQVVALMLAPLVLRKMGLVSGTAAMMMATALALGGLAAGPAGWVAAAVFMTFTSCQWMSDPGVNTLLMDRVREQERTGASALTMLVAFAAQLVASLAGGAAIARFGYSAMLACAAGLAAVAALAFRALPAGRAVAGAGTAQPALLQVPVRVALESENGDPGDGREQGLS
jgi:predicted MFS family arabinose efflux permease